MLGKTLVLVLVVGTLLGIALWFESRRERDLRAWVAARPGGQLHWPFNPAEHPMVPAAELVERMIQRPPTGWASAVRRVDASGEVWLIEFRTTPLGKESSHWFTLVARRIRNGVNAGLEPARSTIDSPGGERFDPWVCDRREGFITLALLGDVFDPPQVKLPGR